VLSYHGRTCVAEQGSELVGDCGIRTSELQRHGQAHGDHRAYVNILREWSETHSCYGQLGLREVIESCATCESALRCCPAEKQGAKRQSEKAEIILRGGRGGPLPHRLPVRAQPPRYFRVAESLRVGTPLAQTIGYESHTGGWPHRARAAQEGIALPAASAKGSQTWKRVSPGFELT